MVSRPVRHPGTEPPRRGWTSLERQLPLLMTSVLAVVLLSALTLNYVALRRLAIDRAAIRLASAADRLGMVGGRNAEQFRTRLRSASTNPTLAAALSAAAASTSGAVTSRATRIAAARATLDSLLPDSDSQGTIELWSVDGRRIAYAGQDLRAAAIDTPAAEGRDMSVPLQGLDALAPSDSGQFGDLFYAGGSAYFWVVAPVSQSGTRLGHLARRHQVRDGEQGGETIRRLIGDDVSAFYRNPGGDVWIALTGDPAQPLTRGDPVGPAFHYHGADGSDMLAVEERLGSSPLMIVLAQPMPSVLAGPAETMRTLAVVSLVLLIIGASASWLLSRRITKPLSALTGAAATIASGDYDVRVEPSGAEELAHLGAGFNRMAEEISAARQELEMQTEEAQAMAEELELSLEELHEAQAEAERARNQAEAASRAKTDFLTIMSHELRTPLNAIGGYTELMEMELRGPITAEQRRDLARIRESQKHLLGLISAVLDLGRIEAGRLTYRMEPVALDVFLANVAALVEPQAAAKSLTLECSAPSPRTAVMADREKLRQILLNLLSNAIRHTAAGGRVIVSAKEQGTAVTITVQDTGEGIAPDALEHIFEPFVQLERSLTSTRDGLGLGLAISRDLARGMGGDLTATSQPGEGACFVLTLLGTDGPVHSREGVSGQYPSVDSHRPSERAS